MENPLPDFGKPAPLTVPELSLLAYLADHPASSMRDIKLNWAYPNGVSLGYLTEFMDRAEALGYIDHVVRKSRGRPATRYFTRTLKAAQ